MLGRAAFIPFRKTDPGTALPQSVLSAAALGTRVVSGSEQMLCEERSHCVPLCLLDSQCGGSSRPWVWSIAVLRTLRAGNHACCLGDAPGPSAHYPGWQRVRGHLLRKEENEIPDETMTAELPASHSLAQRWPGGPGELLTGCCTSQLYPYFSAWGGQVISRLLGMVAKFSGKAKTNRLWSVTFR